MNKKILIIISLTLISTGLYANSEVKDSQEKKNKDGAELFQRVIEIDKQFSESLSQKINQTCGKNTIKKYKDELKKANEIINNQNQEKKELIKRNNEVVKTNNEIYLKYKELVKKYNALLEKTGQKKLSKFDIDFSDISIRNIRKYKLSKRIIYRGEIEINGTVYKIQKNKVIKYKGNRIKIKKITSDYVLVEIKNNKNKTKEDKIFLD